MRLHFWQRITKSLARMRPQSRRRCFRPALEILEDRQLLAATWLPQGPSPSSIMGGTLGIAGNQTAGAVTGIAIDPNNSSHVVIGTSDGGIWTTNDVMAEGGPVWTPRTDTMPFLGISDVEFSPLDNSNKPVTSATPQANEVIYAGTGRFAQTGRQAGQGVGLYKSTDGGSSWSQIGAATFTGLNITKVLPTNSVDSTTMQQVVLVATGNGSPRGGGPTPPAGATMGLYRSTNGGQSWTLISGSTAGGNTLPAGAVTDIVFSPADNRYYAAVPGQGVYFSTDVGKTWQITAGNASLAAGTTSRIALAVSGTSSVVYAGLVDTSAQGGAFRAVFRSSDKGATWNSMGAPTTNLNPNGQGYLNFAIAADPIDRNTVYISGASQSISSASVGTHFRGVYNSTTTTTTWTSLDGTGASDTAPHVDSRFMAISPGGTFMLESDDGGLYRLNNPFGTTTGGTTQWFSANGNLQVFEFQSTSYDSVNHTLFGGTQDNGSPQQNTAGSPTNWADVTSGDGQITQAFNRYVAGQRVQSFHYTTAQNLSSFNLTKYNASGSNVGRTDLNNLVATNVGNGFLKTIDTLPSNTIYAVNAADPYRFLIGTSFLYEYTSGNTGGSNIVSLGGSQQGTRPDGSMGLVPAGNVGSVMAIAYGTPTNADLTYVGTASGSLYYRTTAPRNADGSFQTGLTNGLPIGFSRASSYSGAAPLDIVIDPNNSSIVYVLDTNGVIWRTTNGGAGPFEAINGTGLPANMAGSRVPTNVRSIALFSDARFPDRSVLFAGGIQGVFSLTNPGGVTSPAWSQFGTGLPNTVVTSLIYNADDNVLVAGTLGRGIWQVSNLTTEAGVAAPVLGLNGSAGSNFETTFTQGGSAVALTGTVSLTDSNNTNMRSARILLTNPAAQDSITVDTTGTSITASSYDPTSGILTLTGADTLANYQKVLGSLKYINTAPSPIETARVIVITVNDGEDNSNRVTSTVNIARAGTSTPEVDATPTQGQAAENSFTAEDSLGADPIAPQAKVTASTNLTEALVVISNPVDAGQEFLGVSSASLMGTNISAHYFPNSDTLVLSGSDTAAHYQQVLESLTYADTALVPSNDQREVTIVVSDGSHDSMAAELLVDIQPLNLAPVIKGGATFTMLPIQQNQFNNPGTLISTLIQGFAPGGPISDPDPGAPLGIVVTGADNTNGTWEFSVDSGTTWTPFDSPSDSHATALADEADTLVRFVPNLNFVGTIPPANGLTFRAWDQSPGVRFTDTEDPDANGGIVDASTNGGNTAFSATSASAGITVTVNPTPPPTPTPPATPPAMSPLGCPARTLSVLEQTLLNLGLMQFLDQNGFPVEQQFETLVRLGLLQNPLKVVPLAVDDLSLTTDLVISDLHLGPALQISDHDLNQQIASLECEINDLIHGSTS